MDRWKGKIAVVTGASSGVGRSVALALADRGVIVVGMARREETLKEMASKTKGQFHAVKCDVSKEDEVLKAFKWVEVNLGGVDILVNSAGVIKVSKLTSGKMEDWKAVMDCNVLGLSMCTREAIKSMRGRGDNGHIIHINSVGGHYVPQYTHVFFGLYPASKFAVTALTESLRVELGALKSSIKVTSISPGAIFTELADGVIQDLNLPKLTSCPPGYLEAEDVANAVLYALGTRPGVQVHELIIRAEGIAIG